MRIRSPFTRLVKPYAEDLLRAKPNGATVDDLHKLCLKLGIISQNADHHVLSALGHAFRAANGINSGRTVASKDPVKKGARQVVWVRSPYKARN